MFDPALLTHPCSDLFSCEALADRALVTGWAHGRGETCFFRWGEHEWVLRHFRRGGVIAQVLKDMYLGCNVNAARSWKEWHLLRTLYNQGYPVPRPVAARVVQNFGWYRADLITVRIPGSRSLGDCLHNKVLPREVWFSIGACVKKFHNCGFYHADLNAKNILLDDNNKVYLIDFDRCKIKKLNWWKNYNLKRLRRSLCKHKINSEKFNFSDSDWSEFMNGYCQDSCDV